MDFLKAILGDELYAQVEEKVNAYNGNEANKDKQIKVANLGTGDYVSKLKHDDIVQQLAGKQTELDTANNLIAELQKDTKGNEELQQKISSYETQMAELKAENAKKDIDYAFNLMLMDAGVKEAEAREFLIYKYEKQLKEQGKSLELDDNKHIKGAKDIVDELKTANPTHFEAGGEGRKVLDVNRLKTGDPAPATVTKEQFRAMTYEERLALKQKDENLYNQLKK